MDIKERVVESCFEIPHVKTSRNCFKIQEFESLMLEFIDDNYVCNVNFWFFSVLVCSQSSHFLPRTYHSSLVRIINQFIPAVMT